MTIMYKKLIRIVVIAAPIFLLTTILYIFTPIFSFLENKSYDFRARAFADSKSPSEYINLVVLDQDSLDWASRELGWSWPWPRSAYGDIVRFFDLGNAYSVTFDVLYTEPSIYGVEDDENFAQASKDFGGVVQTVFFSEQYGNTDVWPNDTQSSEFHYGKRTNGIQEISVKTNALFPIANIRQEASSIGSITSTTDGDGIIRKYTFFELFSDNIVPSLALASLTAREYAGIELNYDISENKTYIGYDGITIPGTPYDEILLRFRSSIDAYIPYSARDILESYQSIQNGDEPLLEAESFENTYVFFAFYAPGLFDIGATPISTNYPGAGVHITALDNLLQNDFILSVPLYVSLIMILCVSFFACIIQQVSFRASIVCAPMGIVFLTVIAGVGYIQGFHIPYVAPLFALCFSFAVSLLVSYNTEYKQKRFISSTFKQYLSPAVIDKLIENPDSVKLGGELKDLSIFFSDIEGFTSISETMSPESLTEFLNEYLSAMTDIILDSGGTIDKYEGDAIIAFWNAPLDQEDHGKRAIEAAVLCQSKLSEINGELEKKAGKPIKMRIGINTGCAVVGNMGSKNRFDYTMIGDTVNLCARLEGLNKQFCTYTMCSENAMKKAIEDGTDLQFRELARVMVVGKNESIRVYEPMEGEEHKQKSLLFQTFSEGLELFYSGKLTEAVSVFETIREIDIVAKKYIQKCMELLIDKESIKDGIWRANEK